MPINSWLTFNYDYEIAYLNYSWFSLFFVGSHYFEKYHEHFSASLSANTTEYIATR